MCDVQFSKDKALQKAQKLLSEHRKELLDNIHAEERKISCLDYLVYEMNRSV